MAIWPQKNWKESIVSRKSWCRGVGVCAECRVRKQRALMWQYVSTRSNPPMCTTSSPRTIHPCAPHPVHAQSTHVHHIQSTHNPPMCTTSSPYTIHPCAPCPTSGLPVDHYHLLSFPSWQPQSEANRYSLPTTYIEMQRPKSSDGRRSGGGLGLSDMNSSGARLKNGPDPPRALSRTVSASAVSTLEASSQTSLLSSASTNSLVSGKTMYMPSASRRQRRSSLVHECSVLLNFACKSSRPHICTHI